MLKLKYCVNGKHNIILFLDYNLQTFFELQRLSSECKHLEEHPKNTALLKTERNLLGTPMLSGVGTNNNKKVQSMNISATNFFGGLLICVKTYRGNKNVKPNVKLSTSNQVWI